MEKFHLYIVLTRTNTVLSRIIQWIKNDEYTHAAIALDMGLNSMYSFGRKHTYNPFIGRFRKETFDQGAYKLCKTLPGAIMEIEVSKEQYEKVKALLGDFIANEDLYKYNYIGLFHGLFEREAYDDHRFLCSEFVYYLLKESNIVDFKIPRNLVRPQNFLRIQGKIIYQGDLKAVRFTDGNWSIDEERIKSFSPVYQLIITKTYSMFYTLIK